MSKLIIFDFDGVLADSVEPLFEMNRVAAETIGKTLTKDQYLAGFEGHINEQLAIILDLTEEEKERFVSEKAILFPRYNNEENVRLFEFAEELVKMAASFGELWIISSSPQEAISKILNRYDLAKYFAVINGQNRQSKHLFLKAALADEKNSEVFFITDTVGDLKAAKEAAGKDITTIAVAWGFHNPERLTAEGPNYLADVPEQVLSYLRSH